MKIEIKNLETGETVRPKFAIGQEVIYKEYGQKKPCKHCGSRKIGLVDFEDEIYAVCIHDNSGKIDFEYELLGVEAEDLFPESSLRAKK